MPATFRVVYKCGKVIAVGRSEQDAAEIAQHIANTIGESVLIIAEVGDFSREVAPEKEVNGKGRDLCSRL